VIRTLAYILVIYALYMHLKSSMIAKETQQKHGLIFLRKKPARIPMMGKSLTRRPDFF